MLASIDPEESEPCLLPSEDVVEPALPVFDAHHHFWDRDGGYHATDFNADVASGGHDVRGSVFVECHWSYDASGPTYLRSVGETRAAASEAPKSVVRGIVANVDLMAGDAVPDALGRHLATADGLLRGVRHATAFDSAPEVPNPWGNAADMLVDPRFRAGLRRVADAGLIYEALVLHPQLDQLIAVARALPDVTIVLGHLGLRVFVGPYAGARNTVDEAWRSSLRALAECRNVRVKISGLGIARFGFDLPPRFRHSDDLITKWQDDICFVIDTFGPTRCMCGSNFPVDRAAFDYGLFWNALKRITTIYTPQERRDLLHDTASRLYGGGAGAQTVLAAE